MVNLFEVKLVRTAEHLLSLPMCKGEGRGKYIHEWNTKLSTIPLIVALEPPIGPSHSENFNASDPYLSDHSNRGSNQGTDVICNLPFEWKANFLKSR